MSKSPLTLSNTTTYPVFLGVSIADRIDTDFMKSKSGYFFFRSRNNTNLPMDVAENK